MFFCPWYINLLQLCNSDLTSVNLLTKYNKICNWINCYSQLNRLKWVITLFTSAVMSDTYIDKINLIFDSNNFIMAFLYMAFFHVGHTTEFWYICLIQCCVRHNIDLAENARHSLIYNMSDSVSCFSEIKNICFGYLEITISLPWTC